MKHARTARRGLSAAAAVAFGAAVLPTMQSAAAGAPTPDETRIAFASNRTTGEGVDNPEGDYEVFTMRSDGSDVRQLTANAAFDFAPRWSPDGERIAFETDRDRFSHIYVMAADGSAQTAVTSGPSINRWPAFAPTGDRLAFTSNRTTGDAVDNPTGDSEVFAVDLDGSALRQLTINTEHDIQPAWSPNGRKIAWAQTYAGQYDIATMRADGFRQRLLTAPGSDEAPVWSPDGKQIAFGSTRDGERDVWVMAGDGDDRRNLTANGLPVDSNPSWSPDGSAIAFGSTRDGGSEIHRMAADGSQPRNLTNDPAADFTPDWQPHPTQEGTPR